MGKCIDGGWVPEDDPMFNGQWMMFSVRRPELSTEPGEPEKPVSQKEKTSEQSQKTVGNRRSTAKGSRAAARRKSNTTTKE